ncbi:T9SS C-terminal target domain-containing protein [bacterium]|nr:MAG: T9SS C-terminal target domain-containing protein [bacterium]
MKKAFALLFFILITISAYSQLKYDFNSSYINAEKNPQLRIDAENLAVKQGLPYNIYIKDVAMVEAIAVENGNVIYSVITNFLHPYNGSYCAYYDDIRKNYDLSKARITYGYGTIDNSGEQLIFKQKKLVGMLYLIPCFTSSRRNVWAFDFNTGDLVDSAFVPYSSPILQAPRKVLQISRSRIIIADQVSDVVQLFDTSGAFIQTFAPSTGLNNAILDNIRDMIFRDNGNLLVTNAGTVGNSQNTIQQFSLQGVFLNTFASDSINSPYNLLFRNTDLLESNSSGAHNIIKFNKNTGAYTGDFLNSTLNFPQQMINLTGGRIALCEFSGVLSGIRIYDSLGILKDTLKGVTGVRGVWRLPNGNFLTTNSVGIYEINGTTGNLVRTIVSGYNFNCISVFDPNFVTGSNEVKSAIPDEFKLFNNYPNPFNPSTKIKFNIAKLSDVRIVVYDAIGREVRTLVNESLKPGTYEASFDGSQYPSGVYFYKLTADGFSETKSMILLK